MSWPDALIGLPTGDQIFVLDVDPRHAGDETLARWEAKNGLLPLTVESRTPGGGRHLYFRATEDAAVASRVGALGPGIDVRGTGGYVIVPPSPGYSWVSNRTPIEAAPDALIRDLCGRSPLVGTPVTRDAGLTISEGRRNAELTSLAGTMRRRGMTGEEIEAALLEVNRARCTPPLPADEVRRVAGSIQRYQPETPHQEPPEGIEGLPLTALNDLLNEEEEVLRWCVDGMIPSGGLAILAAKPKVGKSTLARQLALAVARGEPFLGRDTSEGPVIYLALEEKRGEVRSHFRALGATDDKDIHCFFGSAPENLVDRLKASIVSLKPNLVIVDVLFRAAKVKDASDYAQVLAALTPYLNLARETGAAVLVLHHEGKVPRALGDSILGSTAILGTVDTALLMRRAERFRCLSSVQRYGSDLPETILDFDPETRRTSTGKTREETDQDRIATEIESALRDHPEGLTEGAVLDEIETGKTGPRRKALRHLLEAGHLERSGKGVKGDPYVYRLKPRFLVPEVPVEQGNRNREDELSARNTDPNSRSGGTIQDSRRVTPDDN
jgi:hypothetical protein